MGAKKNQSSSFTYNLRQNYLQQCMRAAALWAYYIRVWNTEHAHRTHHVWSAQQWTHQTRPEYQTHSPLPRHNSQDTRREARALSPRSEGRRGEKTQPTVPPQVPNHNAPSSLRPFPCRREPPPRRSRPHRSWIPSSLRSARPHPLQAAAAVIRWGALPCSFHCYIGARLLETVARRLQTLASTNQSGRLSLFPFSHAFRLSFLAPTPPVPEARGPVPQSKGAALLHHQRGTSWRTRRWVGCARPSFPSRPYLGLKVPKFAGESPY
jgi:hypothetical protein